jgi:lipoprotein-releasing system permease protein
MRFEAYVAMRYLRSKRKSRFISLITLISVAGVSVGVIALIVVMSVMTGFDNALRDTVIGNRAHLVVTEYGGRAMQDPDKVGALVRDVDPQVQACAPFIQVESLLISRSGLRPGTATGGYILGIDPKQEGDVTMLADNLTQADGRTYGHGKLPEGKQITLGYLLAERLGVDVNDMVEVMTYREKVSLLGARRGQSLWLEVSGISQAKMSEFDSGTAFVDLPTAQLLTGREGVDGVHCRLIDPMKADFVGARIFEELGYRTVSWKQSQAVFFAALKQEKFAMFIILLFIVIVAAFNITSTLIMLVMEKRRDVGILRTLGMSTPAVLRLFILEGLYIGLSGTVLGVIGGTLLAYNLNPVAEFVAGLFHIDLFNSQIYYFDRIPVDVVPRDVLAITLASIVLTFVSTLYPAWSAARVSPVEALRYE